MNKGAPFDDVINDPDLLQPSIEIQGQDEVEGAAHNGQTPGHGAVQQQPDSNTGNLGSKTDSIPDERYASPIGNVC